MHYLTILLIILTVFLYNRLKGILNRGPLKINNNYEQLKQQYNRLYSENVALKKDNSVLSKTAEDTIALYDITREICKSLDQNKLFANFRSLIKKYIEADDCKFLVDARGLSEYKDYTVSPLQIDKDSMAYILAKIKEQDKDKFNILAQQFLLGIKRAFLYHKVQEQTIMDSLTAIFGRRYFLERFHEEIERSKKFKYNFSFLMVDIDHFKEINDHHGHMVGDAILKKVAETIKENIRQIDIIGRYGGEEFSIILVETDRKGALFAAERIRLAVEQKEIRVYDENLLVTISIGISVFPKDASSLDELIEQADSALYRAKEAGRNRVC